MKKDLVNLSFYRFSPIAADSLLALRAQLKAFCIGLDLKGTILLAPEGINAGVSGARDSLESFKDFVCNHLGVERASFKEASIQEQSFKRMLVKIKKEIITVGDTEIRPDIKTGKYLPPAELKKWLDEGRPVVLLDTRNNYEIEVGTFSGAQDLGLSTSRQFAEKAAAWSEKLKDQTIVTFCTGGIRCEKASAVLLKLGMNDVYQLEGGILRYFEENGASHFNGNCFVFDWRLAVDEKLDSVVRSEDPAAAFGIHKLENSTNLEN